MDPIDAGFWHTENNDVRCTLCPHNCLISVGNTGICGMRRNDNGRLVTLSWGQPCAIAVDPIEKKPLYHFLPGSKIFSIGTYGCNLQCKYCQNCDISQVGKRAISGRMHSPDELVERAISAGCTAIAFTYNEPTIFTEYAIETAILAHQRDLKTVSVTNGYIAGTARSALYTHIDAANVDLKAFSDDFYRTWTGGTLAPVLDTLIDLKKRGVWLEITTLLIPGLNSDDGQIEAECKWILENIGPDVPLHFSAFTPRHLMKDRPRTPPDTLTNARQIASEIGLLYVYEDNVVSPGNHTWCRSCGELLIRRDYGRPVSVSLDADDQCKCGRKVNMVRCPPTT